MKILKKGNIEVADDYRNALEDNTEVRQTATGLVELETGEYVFIQVLQGSEGNLGVQGKFMMHWIHP